MNFIKRHSLLLVIIFLASFVFGNNVLAGFGDTLGAHILDALSTLVYVFVMMVGKLIGLMITVFVEVIQYNNFGNEALVLTGWEIIRDLCNMGFVVILLVIAIASILQIDTYGYKNRLFKIMMMAVLINFSKLFTLLLIDISQYVMLEFAAGIKSVGAGNFIDVLNINTFLNTNISEEFAATKDKDAVSFFSIAVSIILAGVVSVVALFVIAALTIIIIIRIVALWVLIIFSPIAYLLAFSPFGQRYSSQWWGKFTSYCVTGPVMVFLVWLSLASLKATTNSLFGEMASTEGGKVGLAAIGSPSMMGSFLFACIMLLASLKVASELGGMAASVASKASGSLRSWGNKALDMTKKAPGKTADAINRKILNPLGVPDLNLARRIPQFKQVFAEKKQREILDMQDRANAKFAGREGIGGQLGRIAYGTSNLDQSFQGFMGAKSIAKAFGTSRVFGKPSAAYGDDVKKLQAKIKENKDEKAKIVSQDDFVPELDKLDQSLANIATALKIKNEEKQTKDNEIQKLTKKMEATPNLEDKISINKEIKGLENDKLNIDAEISNLTIDADNITIERDKKDEERRQAPDVVTANKQRAEIDQTIQVLTEERDRAVTSQRNATVDTSAVERMKVKKINEKISEIEQDKTISPMTLLHDFAKAHSDGKKIDSAALLEVLGKKNELRRVARQYGYDMKPGLSEADIEAIRNSNKSETEKEKEIKAGLGFNNFMMDFFGEGGNGINGLKMDNEAILNLQDNIVGAMESAGDYSVSKTVKVNKDTGKHEQVFGEEQAELAYVKMNKKGASQVFLRGIQPGFLGNENKNGDLDVHTAGLTYMTSYYKQIKDSLDSGNFSTDTAAKIATESNKKKLMEAMILLPEKERGEYKQMIESLMEFGKRSGGGVNALKNRISAMHAITDTETQNTNKTSKKKVKNPTPIAGGVYQPPIPNYAPLATPEDRREIINNFNSTVNNYINDKGQVSVGNNPEQIINKLRDAMSKITSSESYDIIKSIKEQGVDLEKQIQQGMRDKTNVKPLQNKLNKNNFIYQSLQDIKGLTKKTQDSSSSDSSTSKNTNESVGNKDDNSVPIAKVRPTDIFDDEDDSI